MSKLNYFLIGAIVCLLLSDLYTYVKISYLEVGLNPPPNMFIPKENPLEQTYIHEGDQIEIYTMRDIYFVDLCQLEISTETGNVYLFHDHEAMFDFIADMTAADTYPQDIKPNKDTSKIEGI